MMEFLNLINEVLKKMNANKLDMWLVPCRLCMTDSWTKSEMRAVMELNEDENSFFNRELVATYHTLIHSDIHTCQKILHFKDARTVLAIFLLAEKVNDKNSEHGTFIMTVADDILTSR